MFCLQSFNFNDFNIFCQKQCFIRKYLISSYFSPKRCLESQLPCPHGSQVMKHYSSTPNLRPPVQWTKSHKHLREQPNNRKWAAWTSSQDRLLPAARAASPQLQIPHSTSLAAVKDKTEITASGVSMSDQYVKALVCIKTEHDVHCSICYSMTIEYHLTHDCENCALLCLYTTPPNVLAYMVLAW